MSTKCGNKVTDSLLAYYDFYGSAKGVHQRALFFDKRDIRQLIEDGFIRNPFDIEKIKDAKGIILKIDPDIFKFCGPFAYFHTDSLRETWKEILSKVSSTTEAKV